MKQNKKYGTARIAIPTEFRLEAGFDVIPTRMDAHHSDVGSEGLLSAGRLAVSRQAYDDAR